MSYRTHTKTLRSIPHESTRVTLTSKSDTDAMNNSDPKRAASESESNDDTPQFAPRLDGIETQWTLVQRAHHASMASAGNARQQLVLRYSASIRGYIEALTRNSDESDEIAQDVVVRLLRGDFAGADPNRGRFRDLLKVAIRNMVKNFWSKSNRRKTVDHELELVEDLDDGPESDPWLDEWRNNLLENAWLALEAFEQEKASSRLATVLKVRTQFPDDSSQQLADRLSQSIGKPVRADSLRQMLRRARVRFAELLVEEVGRGLNDASPDHIENELINLGLYETIKDVLPPGWGKKEQESGE